jgi:hypothetical protein
MSPEIDPDKIRQAMVDPRWAALTRADLSLPAIGTWSPQLPRDTRLLVPADAQALVVSAPGAVSAVPTETVVPDSKPGDPTDQVLPRPPAPFADPADRERGVHLHVAMPDGLTRGDAGAARSGDTPAGNPTGLPALPDRWVVVRLLHGSEAIRSWVLEADRGDHHELAGWTEPGPVASEQTTGAAGRRVIAPAALTAVSGGDLAWAATYDAVVDRFAFHDDLADLADTTNAVATYFIAGWWSDAALDPLHDATTLGAYSARATALGWMAPEPAGITQTAKERDATSARRDRLELASPQLLGSGLAATGNKGAKLDMTVAHADLIAETSAIKVASAPAAPRQTLIHGVVFGVALDGSGPDRLPAADALEVGVGPSGFGALAALLADGTDAERDASERLLAAFAANLLSTIDAPAGLVAADEDRHASGFVAASGGLRSQPDRVAEGDPLVPPGGPPASPPAPESSFSRSSQLAGSAQAAVKATAAKAVLTDRSAFEVIADAARTRFGEPEARPRAPRSFRDVEAPAPRSFLPADLAFVVRGAARSLRHGHDGVATAQGLLACRLPTQVVGAHEGVLDGAELPDGLRSLQSGAVPPELDLLLREAVLTDPYRVDELAAWAAGAHGHPPEAARTRLIAEMTLRYAVREEEPVLGGGVRDQLRRASLWAGEDMSPIGWTRWAQPWVPLWCDWELALLVDDTLDRWTLGQTDLEVAEGAQADASTERIVSARTLVASSSARAVGAQVKAWLDDEDKRDQAGQGQLSEGNEKELADAVAAANGLDVLTGSFRGVRETLLGLDPVEATRVRIDPSGAATSKPPVLGPPLLLAGGAATIRRLRVVDAFGRFLDVPDDVLAEIEVAATNRHADGSPTLALPPRLQRPSRLWFRLVDPRSGDDEDPVEARIDQEHPDLTVSPVAGWLLPDHVDEALECFDASGAPLGQLMHDPLTNAVVWEGAPGRPGPIGGPPDPGSDPGTRHVASFAVGLIEADAAARNASAAKPERESALSALLRAIDTTLWTVDPLGTLGTGAVAGLVGRPIAVVRALLRLDVLDDLDELALDEPAARDARRRVFDELAARAIAVRLGELTRTDDGLLGYVIDDDYRHLRVVAPEIRDKARASGRLVGQLTTFARGSQAPPAVEPITHPYLAKDPELSARAEHTVALTLLLAPGGKVHATSGVLPRKSLALARDWFHAALERLSPSFRVGPVLTDPTAIRMPKVTGLGGEQQFTRRDTPLSWRDDPILAASQAALLPDAPAVVQEGWIRVSTEAQDGQGRP